MFFQLINATKQTNRILEVKYSSGNISNTPRESTPKKHIYTQCQNIKIPLGILNIIATAHNEKTATVKDELEADIKETLLNIFDIIGTSIEENKSTKISIINKDNKINPKIARAILSRLEIPTTAQPSFFQELGKFLKEILISSNKWETAIDKDGAVILKNPNHPALRKNTPQKSTPSLKHRYETASL